MISRFYTNFVAEAHCKLGSMNQQDGRFELAIKDYSKAIQFNPGLAGAYYGRGVSYFLINNYESAWDDLFQYKFLFAQKDNYWQKANAFIENNF